MSSQHEPRTGRTRRARHGSLAGQLGRLCQGLLMALVLLVAQHAALRHELSHLHPLAETQEGDSKPAAQHGGPCDLCLSFAQLDAAAAPAAPAALQAASGFAFAAQAVLRSWAADPPPSQSRGPPRFL